MKRELQDKLISKYPELFADSSKSMMETCMCWGCECGDGWYDLLDCTLQVIDRERQLRASFLDEMKREPLWGRLKRAYLEVKYQGRRIYDTYIVPTQRSNIYKLTQVKEKYGELRVYMRGSTDTMDGAIDLAEELSARICEICGDRGTTYGNQWLYTRCEKHQ